MLDKQIVEDVGVFFLMAVTVVSLSYFTGGIQDYVRGENIYNQSAQVFESEGWSNALSVELYVTPGIIKKGEQTSVSWKVGKNFFSCAANSEPLDSVWIGSKTATEGVYVERTSPLSQNITYSIECAAVDGRKSAASMAVIVQ